MKKFLSILTLAAAVVAVSVQPANAQLIGRFAIQPLIGDTGGTVTNNVSYLSTNTYTGLVLDVANQNDVAIQVSAFLLASNFCKPRLDFAVSVDGTTFSTTNFVQVSCLGGLSTNDLSAGVVCYSTNLDVRGIRSLKLFRVANADYYGVMTNLQVSYAIKR